jgi:hypothetical protein
MILHAKGVVKLIWSLFFCWFPNSLYTPVKCWQLLFLFFNFLKNHQNILQVLQSVEMTWYIEYFIKT